MNTLRARNIFQHFTFRYLKQNTGKTALPLYVGKARIRERLRLSLILAFPTYKAPFSRIQFYHFGRPPAGILSFI